MTDAASFPNCRANPASKSFRYSCASPCSLPVGDALINFVSFKAPVFSPASFSWVSVVDRVVESVALPITPPLKRKSLLASLLAGFPSSTFKNFAASSALTSSAAPRLIVRNPKFQRPLASSEASLKSAPAVPPSNTSAAFVSFSPELIGDFASPCPTQSFATDHGTTAVPRFTSPTPKSRSLGVINPNCALLSSLSVICAPLRSEASTNPPALGTTRTKVVSPDEKLKGAEAVFPRIAAN